MLYIQTKSPEKIKEFFETAMNANPTIANAMKPVYLEWLVLNEGTFSYFYDFVFNFELKKIFMD